MKNKRGVVIAAALGLLAGSGMTLTFAQSFTQSAALDPARVAPHIFKVEFENQSVRVLRVTDRNGETQPLHSHPRRVVVHLSPCAWLADKDDGSTHMVSHKFGEVYWAEPLTHGGRTSNVVEECRSVEIEMKLAPAGEA